MKLCFQGPTMTGTDFWARILPILSVINFNIVSKVSVDY